MSTLEAWNEAKENRKRKPWVLRKYREAHPCCELCGSTEFFGTPSGGAHHIRFRSAGGADCPTNLITLCAKHHALAHKRDSVTAEAIRKAKARTQTADGVGKRNDGQDEQIDGRETKAARTRFKIDGRAI